MEEFSKQKQLVARWTELMRRGDFEAAWQISDEAVRLGLNRRTNLPLHLREVWDGRSLTGRRVLVRCHHGLGDTIQFIRYVPALERIASRVYVAVQPRLRPLFAYLERVPQFVAHEATVSEVEADAEIELMELAHHFRTTLDTIPLNVPYTFAIPPRNSEALSVGLVWQAGDWDDRRSVPFELLEPLFQLPDIEFHVLQQRASECGWREGRGKISGGDDIVADAQLLKSLDLLITVDTMPAHLAGALQVPVWNLLCTDADWRWLENRDDSPWYPSMRLFRQERDGDWVGVIKRVHKELSSR